MLLGTRGTQGPAWGRGADPGDGWASSSALVLPGAGRGAGVSTGRDGCGRESPARPPAAALVVVRKEAHHSLQDADRVSGATGHLDGPASQDAPRQPRLLSEGTLSVPQRANLQRCAQKLGRGVQGNHRSAGLAWVWRGRGVDWSISSTRESPLLHFFLTPTGSPLPFC